MAAHLRKIYDDKCTNCSKKATERLYNTRNALIGFYCDKHAPAALKRALDEPPRMPYRKGSSSYES